MNNTILTYMAIKDHLDDAGDDISSDGSLSNIMPPMQFHNTGRQMLT